MATSFNIFGNKTIVVLLILTLISVNAGTIAQIDSNNRTSQHNKNNFNEKVEEIRRIIELHNKAVDIHVNETTESLGILLANKEIQQPFLDSFNKHMNATATAAPKVADNYELLKQVIEKLDNLTASNSTNNTGSR